MGHGALAAYFAGLVPRRNWWKIFLYLMLFGVAIEVAQYYMHAGRNGDPRDLLANVARRIARPAGGTDGAGTLA